MCDNVEKIRKEIDKKQQKILAKFELFKKWIYRIWLVFSISILVAIFLSDMNDVAFKVFLMIIMPFSAMATAVVFEGVITTDKDNDLKKLEIERKKISVASIDDLNQFKANIKRALELGIDVENLREVEKAKEENYLFGYVDVANSLLMTKIEEKEKQNEVKSREKEIFELAKDLDGLID